MKNKTFKKFALAALLATFGTTGATQAATPFMQEAGATAPPIGHVRYCEINERDCNITALRTSEVALTIELWRELNDINFTANSLIRPVTDMEQYQQPERWTIPTLMGDCEDYVLLKRQMLHKAGWPVNALLITVVRDQNGDGHAVLTVRTDRGDLVLDNQADHIVTWDQTPYQYVKRQSERHSGRWTAITDSRAVSQVSMVRR